MTTAILSAEQIRTVAPSIFASQPFHGMSQRYKFVGTDGVIDIMDHLGFKPVFAMQGKPRRVEKHEFTRHFVRLRHIDHLTNPTGEAVPEIVLENSHDGTAAYRMHAGIFRFICSNGLLIASANFGTISVKHAGGRDFENRIADATRQIAQDTPRAFEMVERWKAIILPRPAQVAMAEAAMALKPLDGVRPAALLTARREEDYTDQDGNRDLWRTYNVLQENTMQGGVQGMNPRGRRTRTRSIRSVTATIGLNRGLWSIAEQAAELN